MIWKYNITRSLKTLFCTDSSIYFLNYLKLIFNFFCIFQGLKFTSKMGPHEVKA